jgi:hypothetical protein
MMKAAGVWSVLRFAARKGKNALEPRAAKSA